MKSVFLSHKFTGLSFEEMNSYLDPIVTTLERIWAKVFCSLYLENRFKAQWWDVTKIYERCCDQQSSYDITLWIIWSPSDSYGMKLELDRALLEGKTYILIYKEDVEKCPRIDTYKGSAQSVISFTTIGDMIQKLAYLSSEL